MLKTNKLRFFKILEKASKPLKTSKKVKKCHDDCSECAKHASLKDLTDYNFSDIVVNYEHENI